MPTGMPLRMLISSGTSGALLGGKHGLIGLNQQVSVQPTADILVATGGRDGKPGRRRGLDLQEELQGQSHRVKARAQVGGSSRETQFHDSSCLNHRLQGAQHGIGRGIERERWHGVSAESSRSSPALSSSVNNFSR